MKEIPGRGYVLELGKDFVPYDKPIRSYKEKNEITNGYWSFHGQKKKCTNVKNRFYKDYGGKGLSVHYSMREFIGWWVKQLELKKYKTPSVSRLDHDKGYFFENIVMEEMAENSREASRRTGLGRIGKEALAKQVVIFDYKTKEPLMIFDTIRECARFIGCSQRNVQFCVRGKYNHIMKGQYFVRYGVMT